MAKGQEVLHLDGEEELLKSLQALGEEANRVLSDAALAGGKVIRDAANPRAPGPHIEMKIERSSTGFAEAIVGPDAEHWHYQFSEFGTAAHAVRPDQKEALRFFSESGEVFAMEVQHPGMAAQPFMRPAYDENKDKAAEATAAKFRESMDKAAKRT